MQKSRWQSDLKRAQEAADAGKSVLLQHFGQIHQISRKINQSLVSEADVASEKVIKQILDDGTVSFLAEESGAEGKQNRKWIIDPLDGTTNYLHGLPFFAISIGLEEDGELVLGLIDLPKLNTRYWAIKSEGAFRDGKRIQVSERKELTDVLLATGFSTWEFDDMNAQLKALEKVIRQTRGVRRFGAAAMDLCWVAEGLMDGFWEKHLQPWYTAAGVVIVREAGGKVTDYANKQFHYNDATMLATNGKVHEVVIGLLGGI